MAQKDASPGKCSELLDTFAVCISNELYGLDFLSSFKFARGSSKPIDHYFFPNSTPKELVTACNELKAKHERTWLSLILSRAHACLGGSVEVYIMKDKDKIVQFLLAQTVLSYHQSSEMVKVPKSFGCHISVATKDVRLSPRNDDFVKKIRKLMINYHS